MADKAIGDLTRADSLLNDSLFVMEQDGEAMSLSGAQIRAFAEDAGEEAGRQGAAHVQKGATYTPSVTDDGVISWTNDAGLENPDPVQIPGVASFNGRMGPVVPAAGDYDVAMVGGSNHNHLDNWYFPLASVVDQLLGYVVPPDTAYYSDTGLAAQAGTVSVYTQTNYVNGAYGTVTVDGATYYVAWTAAVRGYATTGGYTIDRWVGNRAAVTLEDVGIVLRDATSGSYPALWQQKLEPARFLGKTVCFSILTTKGVYTTKYTLPETYAGGNFAPEGTGWGLMRISLEANCIVPTLRLEGDGKHSDPIIAAKFEIGDTQTLAHQDADGNWVLNDVPDYGPELAKCQRYQIAHLGVGTDTYAAHATFGTVLGRGTEASLHIYLPVSIRTKPAVSLFGTLRAFNMVTNEWGPLVTGASVYSLAGNLLFIALTFNGALTEGTIYQVRARSSLNSGFVFNANL